jgi:hypothetical protein
MKDFIASAPRAFLEGYGLARFDTLPALLRLNARHRQKAQCR